MIKTGSVLEKLERAVEVKSNRLARASQRVEDLREEYKTCHWSKRREVAGRGFRAKAAFEKAGAEYVAALEALKAEQQRLLQPDSFLRLA